MMCTAKSVLSCVFYATLRLLHKPKQAHFTISSTSLSLIVITFSVNAFNSFLFNLLTEQLLLILLGIIIMIFIR